LDGLFATILTSSLTMLAIEIEKSQRVISYAFEVAHPQTGLDGLFATIFTPTVSQALHGNLFGH
jgi:hypothetical protein